MRKMEKNKLWFLTLFKELLIAMVAVPDEVHEMHQDAQNSQRVIESAFLKLLLLIIIPSTIIVKVFQLIGLIGTRDPKKNFVSTPPGGLAHIALSAIFPKTTYEKQFQQQIADMREESFECDAAHKVWQRRWVVLRGHLLLIASVILYLKVSVVKKCVDIWKAT